MLQKNEQQSHRNRASTNQSNLANGRMPPACSNAGTTASKVKSPKMRAMFPNGAPRSSEYSHGMANTQSSINTCATRRMSEPLRVDHTRVNAYACRRLHHRLEAAVP